MKVAIIGSRQSGRLTVEDIIKVLPEKTTSIVSGGADGVDSLAKQTAKALSLPIQEFLPNYKIFGKIAPVVRNRQIISEADSVIAFWDYQSKGTRNAILECLKQEKPIKIIIINQKETIILSQNDVINTFSSGI